MACLCSGPVASILFADSTEAWAPFGPSQDWYGKGKPWDGPAYDSLHKSIELLPSGDLRDQALKRIQSLDCLNPDRTLASCDPPWAWVPPLAVAQDDAAWRKTLVAAAINDSEYVIALSKVLRDLACSGAEDAIYVVRGSGDFLLSGFQDRLKDAGATAFDLINDLMNKDSRDCPVAAALTDADRASLQRTKRDIERGTVVARLLALTVLATIPGS